MADETTRTEILALKLDSEGALKELTEIGLQMNKVAASKRALEAAYKEGTVTERQYVQGMIEIKAQTTALNTQSAAYQRTLAAHQQLVEKNNGSLESMRAELSGLTAQYIKLSKAERENSEIGGVMVKRMAELNEELKTNEAAYGSFGRNVGNYTQGILAAADGTGLVATVTAQAAGAQQAFTATLNFAKAGLAGNVSMLKIFRLALAATGIGLVVIALAGMVSYLTRTQKGIDIVSRATKGLQIMFGILTDKLSAVGESIFQAFENPKQGIRDLIDLIETQLVNRARAFLVIFDALRNRDVNKLQDGITQLTLGITDASKKAKEFVAEMKAGAEAGGAIEKEYQRIRDAERALNKERSESRKIIKELKMIADNETKSTKERADASRKAMAIELGLDAKRRGLQVDKINNMKAEAKLSNQLASQNDELAQAEIELSEMAAESIDLRTEMQNQLNSILKQGADAAKAAAAESKKAREEAKKLAEEQAKADAEFRQKMNEKEFETAKEAVALYYAEQELKQKESLANGLITQKEYEANLNNLKAERMAGEVAMLEYYNGLLGGKESEIAQKRIDLANFVADNQIAANTKATEAAISNAQKEAEATAAFIDQVSTIVTGAMTEQGFNLQKFSQGVLMMALDTVEKMVQMQIVGASASAVAQSLAQPDSIATFGASGLLRAAVLTGLIKAGFAVFKAAISSQLSAPPAQAQSYGLGGELKGPSHAQGGIRGTGSFAGVEVEGGEVIINRRSSAKYRGLLNAINIAEGGRPLVPGSFNAAGGILIPDSTRRALNGSETGIDYTRLARVLQSLPAPQVSVREIIGAANAVQVKESRVNS